MKKKKYKYYKKDMNMTKMTPKEIALAAVELLLNDEKRIKELAEKIFKVCNPSKEKTQPISKEIEVYEKVRKTINDAFGVPLEEIKMESFLFDDLGADSLDTIELVMAIEEEFCIEIPDEEAEKLCTVGGIVKYINKEKIND